MAALLRAAAALVGSKRLPLLLNAVVAGGVDPTTMGRSLVAVEVSVR